MAQHLLHGTQIGPVLEQVSGKGVPQGMGCYFTGNLRFLGVFSDLPEALPG